MPRGTLQTVREAVRRKSHLLPSADALLHAIRESLVHLRDLWLDVNEGYFELATVVDKWRYAPGEGADVANGIAGWPHRIVSVQSPLSYKKSATSRPVDLVDCADRFRPMLNRPGGDAEVIQWSGRPEGFAILEGDLVLLPVPSTAGEIVSGHYLFDLGVPVERYDGSTSTWYDSVTGEVIGAEWHTPWFDDPRHFDMVVYRACFELAQSDGDQEEENRWARAFSEARRNAVREHGQRTRGGGSQIGQRW